METNQNMETKKQEAIRLAYGEYWEKVKQYVDENGWVKDDKKGLRYSLLHEIFKDKMDVEITSFRPKVRLKSLSGIEDNNGWISIESEEDLKIERGYYWFKWNSADGEENIQIAIVDNRGINLYQEPTHYQPIKKPNPPIF